jgi:hypothetical protein
MTLLESWRKHRLLWLLVAILCLHAYAQNPTPVLESAHGPNAPAKKTNRTSRSFLWTVSATTMPNATSQRIRTLLQLREPVLPKE